MKKPTKQDLKFAKALVAGGTAAQAYREAFNCEGKDPSLVGKLAHALKNQTHVKAAISKMRQAAEKNAEFGIKEVLQEWIDIATADPNELASVRRRCCRHCYGRGHQYQWTDEMEFAHAVGAALSSPGKGKVRPKMPTDEGGYGFNFTFVPHPECTQCRGEGHEVVFIADSRQLTGKARKLYAGVKPTANGYQVITRDQDAALANIARFHGMFTDNIRVAGAGGGPLLTATVPLPTDPVQAASLYAELVKSKSRGE